MVTQTVWVDGHIRHERGQTNQVFLHRLMVRRFFDIVSGIALESLQFLRALGAVEHRLVGMLADVSKCARRCDDIRGHIQEPVPSKEVWIVCVFEWILFNGVPRSNFRVGTTHLAQDGLAS